MAKDRGYFSRNGWYWRLRR